MLKLGMDSEYTVFKIRDVSFIKASIQYYVKVMSTYFEGQGSTSDVTYSEQKYIKVLSVINFTLV